MKINFQKIEKKWQTRWEKRKVFEVKEDSKKKKFYVLEMYPYPSGALHMGHAFNYTIGDIYARVKTMQGFNVLHPIGYDSFGLPAENAAIEEKSHPKKFTENAIKNFNNQMSVLGFSYDWSRLIKTHKPDYYKWDQWIFLKMLEKGLAFRKKAPVNWCPKCKTVLANEQVHDGKCWRHENTAVEIKHLEQWFFKITKYANELYENINKLKNWPDDVKEMQRNWIGKSHGINIGFEINGKAKNQNCIIVHGSPSRDKRKDKGYIPENKKHWMPWLKKELERQGIKTQIPLMPTPWAPSYNEWKKEFEKLSVNKNTILIGHSAGGAFLVRWLGGNKKKITKLILVSPGKAGHEGRKVLTNFYGIGTNTKIKKNIGEIVIFTADDDIDYHIPNAYEYQKELGGELIHLGKGYGHFCEGDMGTKEFPKLLDEVRGSQIWPIFTTRPDTIYGVTFMVVSAQHPQLMDLVKDKQKKEVNKFLKKVKSTSGKNIEELEKEGAFTGSYAVNPVNGEKVPIWVGNFVVADYGSGMVMAVPAHDQRDFEFAKKYNLPIREVIKGGNIKQKAYVNEGTLINSHNFNGINSQKAIEQISKYIEKKKFGKRTVEYKLKDWLISRQRFWGTPIPIVYCDKCGIVPVPEKDLPVKLPDNINFKSEKNPLVGCTKFVNTKCPKCSKPARRETDTMDTFVNSSWYFLRYCDPKNNKKIFDSKKAKYWMPIDCYIGGKEHACMHLIYFRFYTKFLRDLGLIKLDEPATFLFNQGMVHGSDGFVMSKSRGNGVNPLAVIKKYSADILRFYLVSTASPDNDFIWSDKAIQGSSKFINKIINYFSKIKNGKSSPKLESKLNKAIKEISKYIENFQYNLAVIKLRQLFDVFAGEKTVSKKDAESFLKLLSPFCPHIAEELWEKIRGKGFISKAGWPKADEKKINKKFEKQDKAIEKLREDINHIKNIIGKTKAKVYVYVVPSELKIYKDVSDINLFAVNDKSKYDPEGKSKKAKPGRAAIYLE